MKKPSPLLLLLLMAALLMSSCSLRYADTVDVDDIVPELYFSGARLTRYEDNRVTVEVSAELVEQYKDSSENYAKDISFTSYDDEDKISTQGSCGYLFADSSKEIYELYDKIQLYNRAENTNFFADMLRWNKKTEQLTSGVNSRVKVEKDDTRIEGLGFSASGISKNFTFSGRISGEIETGDDGEEDF